MTLMKTRKSLAMALTIVLSLAAGALLVWQFSPRMAGDQTAALDKGRASETPVLANATGASQASSITTRQLSDAVPDCRFGHMQEYKIGRAHV